MSKVGIVCRWDEERGFGFIAQDGGQSDIFVHRTCLVGCNLLTVGDKVVFDAVYDDRKSKFQAVSCSITEFAVHQQPDSPMGPVMMMPPMTVAPQPFFQQPGMVMQQPIPVQYVQMPMQPMSPAPMSPGLGQPMSPGMTPLSSPGTPPSVGASPVPMMQPQSFMAQPPLMQFQQPQPMMQMQMPQPVMQMQPPQPMGMPMDMTMPMASLSPQQQQPCAAVGSPFMQQPMSNSGSPVMQSPIMTQPAQTQLPAGMTLF